MIALTDRTVDLDRRLVVHGGEEIPLTDTEAKLLAFLHAKGGALATRQELLVGVWDYSPKTVTRAVDYAVLRLRRKIEADPSSPRHLLSVHGGGYRLELPRPDPGPSFFGRADEIEAVVAALRSARVVTVTGPGGIGKTRLLRRIAATRLRPTLFLELADARTAAELVRTVAAALDLAPDAPGGDPVEVVGGALAARGTALLVLDNLEQVADVGPLARWSALAPDLQLLCSSRRALELDAERVVDLGPLPSADAAALLVARSPRPIPADDPDVARLVDAVDRIPLAIEIVAARIGLLTIPQLVARAGSFGALRGSAEGRHATLDAAIGWSWDLLAPEDRLGLARLATFRGAFGLEAAEAVVGERGLEVVDTLVRGSLLHADPGRPETERFRLLESVRTFALARLDRGDPAWRRHADWTLDRAERTARVLDEERFDPAHVDALAAATGDLLAILERFPGEEGLRAALALAALAESRGPIALHEHVAEVAVARSAELPAYASRAHLVRGRLGHLVGRPTAGEDLERARALAATASERSAAEIALGDWHQASGRYAEAIAAYQSGSSGIRARDARALDGIGLALVEQGRAAEAVDVLQRARAMATDLGDVHRQVLALDHLAMAEAARGNLEAARATRAQALALAPQLRNRRVEAVVRTHQGTLCSRMGQRDEAVAHWEAALAVHREMRNRRFEAVILGNLGVAALEEGRIAEARPLLEQARLAASDANDRATQASVTANLAVVLQEGGELDAARRLLREALDAQLALGRARSAAYTRLNLGVLEHEAGALDAAEALLREALGSPDPRLAALARAHLGALLATRGDEEGAHAAFAEAETRVRGADRDVLDALRGAPREGGADVRIARRLVAKRGLTPGE